MNPRRDFDEHSDDALHLSALGRSEPARGPHVEGGGVDQSTWLMFRTIAIHNHDWARDVAKQIQREQKRIAGKRWWKRTAATFGWLALVLAAAALLIIGSWS